MSCGIPFLNNISITGDCSNTNSGGISFIITGSTLPPLAPPYTVTELSSSGLLPTSATTTDYSATGLSGGSYSLSITDSCLVPGNNTIIYNFVISTGTCVSLTTLNDTSCGFSNGSLTANLSYDYGGGEVFLYETTNGYQTSGGTTLGSFTFNSLSAGTYYVIADDGGGCTGKSESCIIKPSTPLNFGYYVIANASCVALDGAGKIIVTGQTGTPPYTYSWSANANGQTGSTVTGLTSGLYSVTVTDSLGCTKTINNITVGTVLPVGIVNFITTPPNCFASDGQVTVQLTGGTAPFYYAGSNGETVISFSNSYTFSGLSSGNFTVTVTDAGLCTSTSSVTILPVNGFTISNLSTTNSNCNNLDGEIYIELNGGTNIGSVTYTLQNSLGNTVSTITQGSNVTFYNLSSDTYTVTVSGGSCTFVTNATINNNEKYTITANTSGTTCGFNNGTIQILTSTGGTYTYQIVGPVSFSQPSSTFNNLPPGFYDITVTDSSACQQKTTVYIPPSNSVYFDFFATQPVIGNDGELDVMISVGEPPFTLNWSPNVNGQTGTTVTGLTAGTYSLEVIDDNGCSYTKPITLLGTTLQSGMLTFTSCSSNFQNSNMMGRRGVFQMFNEGFFDLTSGNTGCILNSATFTVDITLNGVNQQNVFYTSTGIDDFPTDEQWVNAIKTLLFQFSGITTVETNIETNKITIKSGCITGGTGCQQVVTHQLDDARVIINLIIDYDISCVDCIIQKIFQDDIDFMFQDNNGYIFQ